MVGGWEAVVVGSAVVGSAVVGAGRVARPPAALRLRVGTDSTTGTETVVVVGARVEGADGDVTSATITPASIGVDRLTRGNWSAPGPRLSTRVPATTDKAMT